MADLPNTYLLMKTDRSTMIEGEAGYAKQKLWLYITGKTIKDVCELLFAPEMTDRIEFHYGSLYAVYEGFNKVELISDDEGAISVRLSGGTQIEEDAPNERNLAENRSDWISGGNGSSTGDISAE